MAKAILRIPSLAVWAVLTLQVSAIASEPPLIAAVKDRSEARVRALLDQSADANKAYGDGSTALHWAAHLDETAIADLLLHSGAKANAADDLGVTPLALACWNGSAAMAEKLIDAGANPNLARVTGETPLMTAARVGNVEVIGRLIAAGAELEAKEHTYGQTALMHAVAEGHPPAVKALLAAGADIKSRSKNRFTPLLFAAQQGNMEVARLLIDAGADVNEAALDGVGASTLARAMFKANTEAAALLVAIDSTHDKLALYLLERGADPNHHGAGRTALHSAVQRQMPDVVKGLLAKGADPNARLEKPMPVLSQSIMQLSGLEVSTTGATPFWLAASYNDVTLMQMLAERGADPMLTTRDGTTPLMVAAGVDYVDGEDKYGRRSFALSPVPSELAAREAVQLCLDLGNDINATNAKGQTALHGATYIGGTILVQFMADRGAKLDVMNKRGQTPWLITQGQYHSGSYFVHEDTGKLLEKLGADTSLGKDLGVDFEKARRRTGATER